MPSVEPAPVPSSSKPTAAPGLAVRPRRLAMTPVASPAEEVAAAVDDTGMDFDEGEEEEPCEHDPEEPHDRASVPFAPCPKNNIPSIHDKSAPKPRAGELQLSASAIKSRMRRVFTPTLKGTLKVSQEIMNDWHSGGAKSQKRRQLEQIFQLCGYDAELWHANATTILSLPWNANKSYHSI